MEFIKNLLEFLDKHPQSNTFLIFLVGLIVAWGTGAFKAIRGIADKLDNRLRVRISSPSARYCNIREFANEGRPAKLFAIWLSAEVGNPSERIATIASFELRYETQRLLWKRLLWKRWSPPLMPLTFPSIPQQELGDNVKLLPVYFSTFPVAKKLLGGEIARDGKVPPGEFQNGYLLFIEECSGDLLPLDDAGRIRIRLYCIDIKGKRIRAKAWAKHMSADSADRFIPGLSEFAQTDEAQSFLHRWESTINQSTDEGRQFLAELRGDNQDHDPDQEQV